MSNMICSDVDVAMLETVSVRMLYNRNIKQNRSSTF